MNSSYPMKPGWYPCSSELLGFAVVQITGEGGARIIHYPWKGKLNPWKLDSFCRQFLPTWGPRVAEKNDVEGIEPRCPSCGCRVFPSQYCFECTSFAAAEGRDPSPCEYMNKGTLKNWSEEVQNEH